MVHLYNQFKERDKEWKTKMRMTTISMILASHAHLFAQVAAPNIPTNSLALSGNTMGGGTVCITIVFTPFQAGIRSHE
jgi:hypothetical protein